MQLDQRALDLVEKHQAAVCSAEHGPELLRQLSQRRSRRRPCGGLLGKIGSISVRLLILYAFCSASLHCLENSFPSWSTSVRTGRVLSYLNLVYLKSYRWLSVQVGLHRSELLHSRDREACLVPNPFYSRPQMCCDCPQPIRIHSVRLNSRAGRDAYRQSVDRHIKPFRVLDSGHRPVSFEQLRLTVLNAWPEVSSGSNRVASLPAEGGPSSLAELLQLHEKQPPTDRRLTWWTYGHMSAIRAVRKLLPRPPFIRPDVDFGLARTFYLLTGSGDDFPVGDLSQLQSHAVLLSLHGSLRVTLSHKPDCCPGSGGNATAVIQPGEAMVIPVGCFQVHFGRHGNQLADYSLAHAFSVMSSTGIQQAAPITGRVPENDDIES